jgi:hypothetical protein
MSDRSDAKESIGRDDGDPPSDRFAIRIEVTRESFNKLLREYDLDVGDRPLVEPKAEGAGTLLAFAPASQIKELEAAGYRVEVGENISEIGRQRQAEVGEGDRFEGGRVAPLGLGMKPGQKRGGTGPGTDEPER